MIGTLSEKTLHAELKKYFEPDMTRHEIPVGSFVADIANEDGIIEIQTRSFEKMRKKLAEFLTLSPVTVVYPLPRKKWLIWIDEETGETSKKRISPKQGKVQDAMFELYKIKPFLRHPNLQLCIVMVDIEEYRLLNGWSADKKRGSTRLDRIPVGIAELSYLRSAEDYLLFIPERIQSRFTTRDYAQALRINMRVSQTTLNILYHVGAVKRVGKQGNLHVYERSVFNTGELKVSNV